MSNFSKLIFLVLISAVTMVCWDLFLPIMPELAKVYGVEPELMSYGITLYALAYVFFSQFTAYFIDKYSPARIVPLGFIIASIINVGFLFVNNFYVFLLLRILLGISLSVTICTRSLVARLFPKEERIKVFAYLTSFIGIGLAIAPVIGAQLKQYFGYQSTFIFQAVYCICGYFISKKLIVGNNRLHESSTLTIKDIILLLKNRDLFYISGINMLSYLPYFVFATFSSLFLLNILNLSLDSYSLVMFALGAATILGGYLAKIANQKMGIVLTTILGVGLINIATIALIVLNFSTLAAKNLLAISICLYAYVILISIGRCLISPFSSKMILEKCEHAISSASSLSMIYTYSFCALLAALISKIDNLSNAILYTSISSGIILLIISLRYLHITHHRLNQ